MPGIKRHFGVGRELVYAEKVLPAFLLDINTEGLDSPVDPNIHHDGGLNAFQRRSIAGPYVSSGTAGVPADVSSLWYLLWLLMNGKATDDSGVTPVSGESVGSTDVNGDLSGTLANTLVNYVSLIFYDTGSDPVAMDDGSGTIRQVDEVVDDTQALTEGTNTVEYFQHIIPGTLQIEDTVPQLVAHDDGSGNIVQDNSSGISGTIDYRSGRINLVDVPSSANYDFSYFWARKDLVKGSIDYLTGEFAIVGLPDSSEALTADYGYGYYVHTLTLSNEQICESMSVVEGKDLYQHAFTGCAISQMVMAFERGLVDLEMDIVGGKDFREDMPTDAERKFLPEYPLAFHNAKFESADYGDTLEDKSCSIDSFSMTVNKNIDGEAGMGANSRYPCIMLAENIDVNVAFVAKFLDMANKQAFWGGADGPSDHEVGTHKEYQLTLDAGTYGNIVLAFPRALITADPHQPAGRTRMTESIAVMCKFDDASGEILTATCTTLGNFT